MPTVQSNPSTFTLIGPDYGWLQSLTFAIPYGVYTSGYWSVSGSCSASGFRDAITTGSGNSATFPDHYNVYGPSSVAVSAAQLSDINGVAGGNLSATLSGRCPPTGTLDLSGTDAVSSLVLVLVGGAAPGAPLSGIVVIAASDVYPPIAGVSVYATSDVLPAPPGIAMLCSSDVMPPPLGAAMMAASDVLVYPTGQAMVASADVLVAPPGAAVVADADDAGVSDYPVPALSALSPSTVLEGSSDFTLYLIGSGFVPASVAYLSGTALPTVYLGPALLCASVTAAMVSIAGAAAAQVWTPAPGGGWSNVLSLVIVATTPAEPPATPPDCAVTFLRARPGWVHMGEVLSVRGLLAMVQGRQAVEVEHATSLDGLQVTETLISKLLTTLAPTPPQYGYALPAYPAYPGWTVTTAAPRNENGDWSGPILPLSQYANANRPLGWLFGGAMILDPTHGWRLAEDLDGSSPIQLDAQVTGGSVLLPPGAGDVFGLVTAGASYLDQTVIGAQIMLRGDAHGIVADQTSGRPASGIGVSLTDDSDNSLAGTGLSDSKGLYRTGTPYGRGEHPHLVASLDAGAHATIHNRKRTRVCLRPNTLAVSMPWCVVDPVGQYHRVAIQNGAVWHWRSDVSTPYRFVMASNVSGGVADTWPRIAVDDRCRAFVYWERSGSTYLSWSDDDGNTWSAPAMALSGVTKPTVAVGVDGTRIVLGLTGSNIAATIQEPGDPTPSAQYLLQDNFGASLQVEQDSFHVAQGHEGPGRWVLVCRILGDTVASEWWSADMRTWKRIV